jgi:catechol 2,3-dioxygenase-like lactoylglutathione lyase family enzyme
MHLNITLAVADLENTAEFYREILQRTPEVVNDSHGNARYLLLTLDNIKIVFQRCEDMEALHPSLLQNLSRDTPGVGLQLELTCPDLAEVYRQVKRYRWPIAYELEDQEHQRRELWLHDPDGYLLVLNEE